MVASISKWLKQLVELDTDIEEFRNSLIEGLRALQRAINTKPQWDEKHPVAKMGRMELEREVHRWREWSKRL